MKASKKADGKMAKAAEPKLEKAPPPIVRGSAADAFRIADRRAQAKFPECFENLSFEEKAQVDLLADLLFYERRGDTTFSDACKKQHQQLKRILAKMGEAPAAERSMTQTMPPPPFDISIRIQDAMGDLYQSLKQLRSSERILGAALAIKAAKYSCR
jgi:hypothetical protein